MIFVAVASLLIAWATQADDAAGPCVRVVGPVMLPEVPESSGLAVSRRDSRLLWSHNDSGNDTILFALEADGTVRGRVRVPVRTIDWEDLSAGACPPNDCLYIADIGDNRLRRQRVQIYRVREPAPGDAQTVAPEVFNATYTDGSHNAEAMFVVGAEVFIVTRDRIATIYEATLGSEQNVSLRPIGQLGLAAVTDAETSRDGNFVVVRTSHEAVLYRTSDLVRGGTNPYLRIPLDGLRESQGEGVALDGRMLYLSSEGRPWSRAGRLVTLRCSFDNQQSVRVTAIRHAVRQSDRRALPGAPGRMRRGEQLRRRPRRQLRS